MKYNPIDIQKELIRSKIIAYFIQYISGNLYYKVTLESGTYQFPIETTELVEKSDDLSEMILSTDLGTSNFNAEMKGSYLNRWIQKAIKNKEFIKID